MKTSEKKPKVAAATVQVLGENGNINLSVKLTNAAKHFAGAAKGLKKEIEDFTGKVEAGTVTVGAYEFTVNGNPATAEDFASEIEATS